MLNQCVFAEKQNARVMETFFADVLADRGKECRQLLNEHVPGGRERPIGIALKTFTPGKKAKKPRYSLF